MMNDRPLFAGPDGWCLLPLGVECPEGPEDCRPCEHFRAAPPPSPPETPAPSPVESPGEEGAESKTCERCGYVGGGGWLPGWDTDPTAGTQPRGMKCPDCNPAPAAAESTRADLAEIERLVSKYGRAIVYGGNGLKALEARATLLSAIRSLAAPEGKRHG